MPTKLKIKMGHIEFEYEGDAAYDNEAVKDLFSHMETLMVAAPPGAFDTPQGATTAPDGTSPPATAGGNLSALAVNTVAARLKVKSGPDMVIAAAAHIQICAGKESFSRKELLAAMQSGKTFFKQSMSNNLTSYVDGLVKSGRLNSLANDEWSLSASELETLRAAIAQP